MKYFIFNLFFHFVFRDIFIFYVTGMRRSGNHAFVYWFSNALENSETELIEDSSYREFYTSKSGKVIFINEVNMIYGPKYIKMMIKNYKAIRQCDYLILSTEDCAADYRNYRVPRYDAAIYIHRSLLNIISSRLHNLQKKAKDGIGWSRQTIDELFFQKLLTFRESKNYSVWSFDDWVVSEEYRRSFLDKFNLSFDYQPSISPQGGGSSFSGISGTPGASELLHRYRNITFPERIVSFLAKPKFRVLLNKEEDEFLTEHVID